jgi:Transcriptional regulator, AbiEi antitoxin
MACMGHRGRTADDLLASLASSTHGVVTRRDLLGAGITHKEIRRRMDRGSLLRVHPGVYRVGHRAPSREARYLAAVKACGDGALLAGRAAAHLWGLLKGAAPAPEVVAPTERHIPGVVVYRARRTVAEATARLSIPVTTVPRTLVDLASSLRESALVRVCHEAEVLHGTTPEQVEAVLAGRPSSPGARTLRRDPSRRDPGHAEQARVPLPRAPSAGAPSPTANQSPRRRPLGRLPLAGVPPHGRA